MKKLIKIFSRKGKKKEKKRKLNNFLNVILNTCMDLQVESLSYFIMTSRHLGVWLCCFLILFFYCILWCQSICHINMKWNEIIMLTIQ